MSAEQAAMEPPERRFSVAEAAYLSSTDGKVINREIDARVIGAPADASGVDERLIGLDAIYYLAAVSGIRTGMDTTLRRLVFQGIRSALIDRQAVGRVGRLQLPLAEIAAEVEPRLRAVEEASAIVASDPGICGGEPVVKGTRIPIRTMASLRQRGVPDPVIAEEYGLSPDQVRLAALYSELHPRRGRRPAPSASGVERYDVRHHAPFAG